MSSSDTGVYAKDPEQTALLDAYDKFAAPIANRRAGSITETLSRMPNDAGESALGDIIADAQLGRDPRRCQWRRRDRLHQSGRRPQRHPEERRRRGDLCRRVRQPAVPQSAGDADADGNADQEHAGAAMARSETAADPAGLERLQLCLGRREAVRRARDRRSHVAERAAHRSRDELPRHREQLSSRSGATASPCSRKAPRRGSASTMSTPCTAISRPTARSRPRQPIASCE